MYFKNIFKKLTFITATILMVACGKNTNQTAAPIMPDSLATNEAIKEISLQIEQNEGNAELFYQRAQIYFNLKYLGMAQTDLQYALRLDSNNALYWYNLARVSYAMNQTKDAAKYYETAIAKKPDYTEAKLKLADLYFLVKEHQKSIDLLVQTLKTDKQNPKVYHMLGLNYREMADTGRAIFNFQNAAELDQTDYESLLYIANLYASQGKEIAFQYFNAAIKLKPNQPEAIFSRAVFAQKQKLYTQAILDYKRVINRDPNNFLCYYNVGYINFETEKYAEAIKNFNTCTRMNPEYAPAYYMKGLVYEIQKNKTDAKLNYAFALNLEPTNKLAKEGLERVR